MRASIRWPARVRAFGSGQADRQWGVTLIDGGTQRLPRIVGYGNAMWPQAVAQLPQPALIADRRGAVASTGQALQAGLDFEAQAGRAVMRDPDVVKRLTEYRERHA